MKVDSGMQPLPTASAESAPRVTTRPGRSRVPAPPVSLVGRHRLLDQLSRAVDDAPLTLVCAPAGSGKTVLVSSWAGRAPLPLGWMTISDRDNDPRAFWWHVRSALADAGAVRLGTTVELFPGADEVDLVVDQLLRSGRPVVLVVDAADRLGRTEHLNGLAAVVDGAGGLLRVVMTTRQEPPLPLHRYRLEGTVAELGWEDLAFTAAELADLLELHGVDPDEEAAGALLARTEGWAAGARMAALALCGTDAGSRLERLAAEYLAAEVVGTLSEAEHDLLLRVAVVEEVPADLAVMLSGRHDAEASLRELARRNAFVHPVRNRPGHHRVSPLLRDLLAAERDAMSMGSDDLHRTAADWYGAAEQLGPAVDQAIAAGDWDLAAAWAVRLMGLVDLLLSPSGGRLELAQRLRDMPARGGPDVQLVRAALALGEGDLDRAREHLAGVDPRRPRSDGDDLFGIRAGDDEASDDEATEDAAADDVAVDDGRLLWAAILGARLGELSGDVQATGDAAERARRSRWPGTRDSGEVQPVLTALLACSQGTAFLHAGELDRAAAALEDAVSAALAGGRDSLTLRCLSMLALAEACRGRLSHAQEVADTAEHVVEHIFEHAAGRVDGARREAARPAALDVAEAWVALERQDLQRAADALTRASRLSESVDPPLLQWVSLLLRARLKRDHGDSAAARHLLRDAGSQVGWLRRSFDDEAAAVGLLAAAAELEPGASVPAHVSESHEVEAMLETARIHGIRGDRRASRSTVAEALALARGERLRRPFAHAAPEVRAMLRTDRELRSQANWLRPDHMTASGERPRTTERALVVEELSERELEVLRHLSALLTTEEIASEMFISANTVRTHIRRILGKLSVSRRHEAVRRARELNLV